MQRQPEAHETQSTTAPYQRSISGPSVAIRGNQRHSEAISASSEVTRRERPIRGHGHPTLQYPL